MEPNLKSNRINWIQGQNWYASWVESAILFMSLFNSAITENWDLAFFFVKVIQLVDHVEAYVVYFPLRFAEAAHQNIDALWSGVHIDGALTYVRQLWAQGIYSFLDLLMSWGRNQVMTGGFSMNVLWSFSLFRIFSALEHEISVGFYFGFFGVCGCEHHWVLFLRDSSFLT